MIIEDEELQHNLLKLMDFASLTNNWNGYGAKPIPEEVILHTGEILRELNHQPEVFPCATGTIQLEYELDNLDYLQMKITQNGEIKLFGMDECGHISKAQYKAFIAEIFNDIIDEFWEHGYSKKLPEELVR